MQWMSPSAITVAFLVCLSGIVPPILCGLSPDATNIEYLVNAFKAPHHLHDNTTIANAADKTPERIRQQGFHPQQLTSLIANMANLGGFGSSASSALGGLRTVMMGGMLYGLSLIPAVVMALGSNGFPASGMLSSLGLGQRASSEYSSAKMPLLTESETKKLLKMLQSAFKQWNVADEQCKMLFVCQMYRQVSDNGVTPDLDLFKEALIHILERVGQRRAGRAVMSLLSQYEHYFEAARTGMQQDECELLYPECYLSLYARNDRFHAKKDAA